MTNYPAPPPAVSQVPESAWIKSSYSGQNNGNCVEIAAQPSVIHVRDSKNKQGASLSFTPEAWSAFTTLAASGTVDFDVVDV